MKLEQGVLFDEASKRAHGLKDFGDPAFEPALQMLLQKLIT